jgi:NAD(P)-dependent dehydrogenase (short-subunit alcohol dehydrogenase family)
MMDKNFDIEGKSIVVTGGTGVLGSEIVAALAGAGANIATLSRDPSKAEALFKRIGKTKGKCISVKGDVLDRGSIKRASGEVLKAFGRVDGLLNAAGGNSPKATTNPEQSFFQLDEEGLRYVSDLNFLGTVLPSQIFGKFMAEQKDGVILNVTSMSGFKPLTRVGSYSAAKAAVSNFTQWLAVHMAQEYSPNIRVNAIAPGFFLTEQNRFLLTEKEGGALTPRGKKIIEHTPMARFGDPHDLVGAVLWLLSPASNFVTGVIVPIDGGFSAYSGV